MTTEYTKQDEPGRRCNADYRPASSINLSLLSGGSLADYDYWPSNRVQTTTYVYRVLDNIDRLESFTVTDGVTTSTTDYTFEGYNRKTEQVTVDTLLSVNKTYAYDETNWLDSVSDTVSGATITYSYDNNGNTTLKSDSSKPDDVVFSYDVANRLVQTEQGATLLGQYDYNASGMRVRHYGSERGDVEYYYDDGAVLEEYVAGAGGGLLAHYRYGDRLLSLDTGTETQYYHHDALGSTVNLTDGAGLTKVSYTLDPWGHIRSQLGTSVNRQIFTGQEHDENTGLIYFGARYYDPDTGRFISQDSYLGEPGTPPSLHRYLYAYSNPTVWVDPDGHEPITLTTVAVVTTLSAITAGTAVSDFDGNQVPLYKDAANSAVELGRRFWESAKSVYRTTINYYTAEDRTGLDSTPLPINDDSISTFPGGFGEISDPVGVGSTESLPQHESTTWNTGHDAGPGSVDTSILSYPSNGRDPLVTAPDLTFDSKGLPLVPYKDGGGHHIPAKKMFEGDPQYDPSKALAVPKATLKDLKIGHPTITGAQARGYSNFSKTGSELTWETIEEIETKALIKGGANEYLAGETVRSAIKELKNTGIVPRRIPWGGQNAK